MKSRPPRFALAPDALDGAVARVRGDELHHLRDVMRLAPGAEITLLAADGAEYAGRITHFAADAAVIEIIAAAPARAARPQLILAAALIKGPRMDFLVEKAAELGAAALWPLVCVHAVVRNPGMERLARWRRLALAAAKQSLAPRPLEIAAPRAIAAIAAEVPKETLALVCAERAEPLAAVVRRTRPHALLIACGPEGGFDPAESAALYAAGFVAAGLGPGRLRSETAALAALAVAGGALDELNRSR